MRILKFIPLIIILTIGTILQISCRKNEKIDTSPGLSLSFSTDTLLFDTVFPTIGSVTQRLIVYNPNDSKVKVSNIRLFGGQASSYRINLNGIPGDNFTDIEIPAGDSLFLFVKVTIDPRNENQPFIVADSLGFITNGTEQHVQLVSWGRDAIFHLNENLAGQHTWDSLKAHVVYGTVRVDTNAMLTIQEGTDIYFHMGGYMMVSFRGSLKVMGSVQNHVTFQGDRLDPFYRDLPGQWGGIVLERGSTGNEIHHARIKNGIFGLLVDQPLTPNALMLTIDNTIIQNMTSTGLYAFGTTIVSNNCVIGDCGNTCLDINFGGSYEFLHLTVGNYWYASVRNSPSVYLSNYTYDTTGQKLIKPLIRAYFGNSILYGINDDELQLDSVAGYPFSYQFENCLIKTEMKVSGNAKFISCMVNKDPVFVNTAGWNYQIDSISPAIDKGIPMGITHDILGRLRNAPPDLGAYEYVKSAPSQGF